MKKNNMNSYVNLFLGLYDQDTKKQEISKENAYNTIQDILFNTYQLQGATLSDAKGHYKHQDKTLVSEPTISIILLFIDDFTVNNIVNDLKVKFNQESILVLKQKMEVSFI